VNDSYADRGVRALVVNVLQSPDQAAAWKEHLGWSIPVLLDLDGKVAESLIIDPEGRIQFYTLLDSRNFDAKLIALQKRLDALLAEETP